MPINGYVKALLAQTYADNALYASLHSGDPSGVGDFEMTVERQPLTWSPGSVDGQIVSNTVSFPIDAEGLATHVGIWDAATGGTFMDALEVEAAVFPPAYSVILSYTQT